MILVLAMPYREKQDFLYHQRVTQKKHLQKSLKYNQSPPEKRNSARVQMPDSPTDPSSEENLESKSLDARLMET